MKSNTMFRDQRRGGSSETSIEWHILLREAYAEWLCRELNGSFGDECLNEMLSSTLTEARTQITAWKEDYNAQRPHSSLGNMKLEKQAA